MKASSCIILWMSLGLSSFLFDTCIVMRSLFAGWRKCFHYGGASKWVILTSYQPHKIELCIRLLQGIGFISPTPYQKVGLSFLWVGTHSGSLAIDHLSLSLSLSLPTHTAAQILNLDRITGLVLLNLNPDSLSWMNPSKFTGKVCVGCTCLTQTLMCLAKYDNVYIWWVWCSLHVLLCHLIMLNNCVWEWYMYKWYTGMCVHAWGIHVVL